MNLVFPIEPAGSGSLAFGWGLTLALLLPLLAGWILTRARMRALLPARYAAGLGSVWLWLFGALPLLVAGVAVGRSVYAASTATFTVTADSLVLAGDWWGREIPRSGLRAQEAEVVDLARRQEFRPVTRTFGTGLPGYASGWFRTHQGEALAYLTRTEETVVVPTTLGYTLLLTPRDPEGLVAALKGGG